MFRKIGIVWVGLLLVVSLTIPALAQDAAACDETEVRTNVQRVIDEGFNQGNLAIIDEVFAEDYVSHPNETDREGFKGGIQAIRAAIPNGHSSVDHVLVEGCDVFFIFHVSGLMEGELALPGQPPIPATGANLRFDLHIYNHLDENGQVSEAWDYQNNLALLMQVGIIPAPEGAAEPTDEAMAAETIATSGSEARNTEFVERAYAEGFNTGDWEALRAFYSPEYVSHDDDGTQQTFDEFVASATALRNAIPDVTVTIHDSVAQGDYVATRVTTSGTFQNALTFPGGQPIPPTGQPIAIDISFLHRLTPEGLIVEDWELFDQISFLSQVGLFNMGPQPEATP
jgi:predicted ester cyclase